MAVDVERQGDVQRLPRYKALGTLLEWSVQRPHQGDRFVPVD
jgi:hypothetical protein